ncbi:hypothetical protein EGI26_09450 [Lacihabitans sp. CCS-44]|uniref:hypothetical protein n=1 Tax=Lacihabitans sp. CCS-44 TaxID=2487331 RepID=UPI0020CDAF74|nr:hypothetical protein [Lacihabitans sp. CCS-44]MCP9755379.1 hypothetical protein [Lacihabitans sp. CCS-44]
MFASYSFANEIRIVFEQNSSSTIVVELRRDNLVLDSAKFDSNKRKDLLLVSNFEGIHVVSFDSKFYIFVYLKKSQDLEVNVDLEKGKFEVIDSFESQQLNRIFENWEREVTVLNTMKEPTFEHFDKAFDNLASEIMSTQNSEIIDWASIFLVDLEKEPSKYMLSLEKFIDFEQAVHERYPSYKFNKMKANFGVRKDNQSGYYWKY